MHQDFACSLSQRSFRRQCLCFAGLCSSILRSSLLLAATLCLPATSRADQFTYREQKTGESTTVEGRLVASGQGVHLVELDDGQYRIIPEPALVKREVKDGPAPADSDTIVARLQQKFGEDLFRSYTQDPFVMGLVLATPLPKSSESRSRNFLRQAARFMKHVEGAFLGFVKEARITVQPPAHPLVVLIFETDADFDKYTNEVTGERGLSASRVAGFYSGLTNYLAIRLSECRTFDVPLHEAIHQQVYNRNVFQRLSPIPHWFDEGIATGFEANQGRIGIGPTKVSPRYARASKASRELTWEQMLTTDSVFMGDVIAGEAYGHAWGLHWLLVTRYRSEYSKYVRLLATKEPLQKSSPEDRLADFHSVFEKSPDELQQEFHSALDAGLKRQKVSLERKRTPGMLTVYDNSGQVDMTAVQFADGRLQVDGQLTNISPIRALTYYVMVETDSGMYANWVVPNVEINKVTKLKPQNVRKMLPGASAGPGQGAFRVRVFSAIPGSEETQAWGDGELPAAVLARPRE